MSPGISTSPSETKTSRPAENYVRVKGKKNCYWSLGVIMGHEG